MIPFPVFVVVVAMLSSIVARILASVWRPNTIKMNLNNRPTIFVGIVSFCDKSWPKQIDQLMVSAIHSERIFFGVLEFVKDAHDSRESDIPSAWRPWVRIHTVSQHLATSLRETRRLCYDHTYKDEHFVLFTRSIAAVRGWDTVLTQTPPNTICCARLSNRMEASFPSLHGPIGELQVRMRPVAVHTTESLPSLLWLSDFSFSTNNAVATILSSSSELEVTAALKKFGFDIRVPGTPIGTRMRHPRGVKSARKGAVVTKEVRDYAESIGLGRPHAMLGLTADATAQESISKFGSVVAARVAIQTVEAEMKMTRP